MLNLQCSLPNLHFLNKKVTLQPNPIHSLDDHTDFVCLPFKSMMKIVNKVVNIQMMIPQKQSVTCSIRQLCQQIESEINNQLKKTLALLVNSQSRSPNESNRLQIERMVQELKSSIVQIATSRLSAIMHREQEMQEDLQQAQDDRVEWKEKYTTIMRHYEDSQAENRQLKTQLLALSRSYEQLSFTFQEIKYKYHELKENNLQTQSHPQLQMLDIARDSSTTSLASQREQNRENQAFIYQKELFLEEIRQSQKEILEFRSRVEDLIQENKELKKVNDDLQNGNEDLQKLLKGEKARSDKLDRQILQILNKNQELKLQILQQKQQCLLAQQQCQKYVNLVLQQKQSNTTLQKSIENLHLQLSQQKSIIYQLKQQSSELRQKNSLFDSKQFQHKQKCNQMKKENDQLRSQLQKLMTKYEQMTRQLERKRIEQTFKYKKELEEVRSKSNIIQREYKSKNNEKMQEITKMHKEITAKLEQKIILLEKGNKQKKQKLSQTKYQVERLYESLQIQVEKQYKANQIIKNMTDKFSHLEKDHNQLFQKYSKLQSDKENLQEILKTCKFNLHNKEKKLKKILEIHEKFKNLTFPKIKQELRSIKLLSDHFKAMFEMQKQQIIFLISKKQQHFKQIIEQSFLHKNIAKQQSSLNHQNQISKWKQNCKTYEQKYTKLKDNYDYLQQKHTKLENLHEMQITQNNNKIQDLLNQNEQIKLDQLSTIKTIDKLKQKCKEVQQYYKLVQDLSRENMILKNKLETVSFYSFKSPQKHELDLTSKRQKFTEESLQKYSKTSNINKSQNPTININDLTAKAQFQKLRLQAAKRQYNMMNRIPHNE